MARIDELLTEYGASHQHPLNKRIHWVCVPLIVWSLLGGLWSIPVPVWLQTTVYPINWAILIMALAMLYYLVISPRLAAGILLVFVAMLSLVELLGHSGVPVWAVSLLVFVLAWIGQFIGHAIEGRRPSFFKDVQFLLIGPLWLLSFVYKKAGWRV